MSDLSIVLPPPNRLNGTRLHDDHPDDHNVVVDAINALYSGVAGFVSTIHMVTYATRALMLADASQPAGTLGYSMADATLAIYVPDHYMLGYPWTIIVEPMHTFTPRCWIGTTELTIVPTTGYRSQIRQEFGYLWFEIHARFGGLDTISGTGNLAVMPPISPSPSVTGTFSLAYAICPSVGAVGSMSGAWDGTTVLSGAPITGQIAIVMPAGAGLMDRSDMGPSSGTPPIDGGSTGQFDLSLAGQYPIAGFVT